MSNLLPNITLCTGKIDLKKGEAMVVGVFEDGAVHAVFPALGAGQVAWLKTLLKSDFFPAKVGMVRPIPLQTPSGNRTLLLTGLGKSKKVDAGVLRKVGGAIVKAAVAAKVKRLICLLAKGDLGKLEPVKRLDALTEGMQLASYQYHDYMSEKRREKTALSLEKIRFAVPGRLREEAKSQLAQTLAVVQGTCLARDLGNMPGNALYPATLAEQAETLAQDHDSITTEVLDVEMLRKKGMNGILGVGQGSEEAHAPRLIIMRYRGADEKEAPLAVVGKAVTFDSGGISLKPAASMEEMKFDMCGGAAVFGFMRALVGLELPINVVGLVPAAENMPSGTAQRPGDIIKTYKGITVEMINTDAEGRMILADALHHAEHFKPHSVIDLATLTGACMVALGNQAAGLMSNDDDLSKALKKAGEASGERAWPLPLYPEYQEQLNSIVADIKNIGGRYAGAITAGAFLSRFVGKDRKWAHLDIAGMAWDLSGKRPHVPKGAVGYGVSLLCNYARTLVK